MRRLWECGKPVGFSIFPQPERGGKGGGDFLFKAASAAALWLPLSPLAARRRLLCPRRSGPVLFASFSFIYSMCIIYFIYIV